MHVAFTPDQLALRDAVRDVLKADETAPPGPDEVWDRLAAVGLPGALLPEADGGLGLDLLDVLLCLTESGRAVVPVPLVETTVVAATLLAGSPRAERLAGGGRRVTASLDGSRLAAWAASSDAVLVSDGPGAVRLLEPVAGDDVPAEDPYRPLTRVPAGTGEIVCDDPARIARARRAGTIATAAQLIGIAAGALELTVAYVRDRTQFGVAVGSFQAVQHQLADALLALEMARPLVAAAAYAHVRHDPGADRDAAAAILRAGSAAHLVARTTLQCHGGMGYTREYPLHRRLLRIFALRAATGPEGAHRAVLATALGLRP